MAPPQRTTPAKRTVANAEDWLIFLDYLEDPINFGKLFSAGRQTIVGGRYVKKSAQWDVATAELRHRGFSVNSGSALEKKWQRFFFKYKAAKKSQSDTGFGVNEQEHAAGITIAQKLLRLCPHFDKVDELFGGRSNVTFPATSGPVGFQHMESAPESIPSSQAPPKESKKTVADNENHGDPVNDGQGPLSPDTPGWVQEQANAMAQQSEDMDTIDGWDDGMDLEEEYKETASNFGVAAEDNGIEDDETTPLPTRDKGPLPTGHRSTSRPPTSTAPQNPVRSNSNAASNRAPGIRGPTSASASKSRLDHDKANMGLKEKPSLATVFQESKLQEASIKLKYFEKKGDWKMKELEDKQEARQDELAKRKFELEFQKTEKHEDRSLQFQEAKKERFLKAKVAKDRNKLELIMAGWVQNKPQDKISFFLTQL